jgi:hypothetical protein
VRAAWQTHLFEGSDSSARFIRLYHRTDAEKMVRELNVKSPGINRSVHHWKLSQRISMPPARAEFAVF